MAKKKEVKIDDVYEKAEPAHGSDLKEEKEE